MAEKIRAIMERLLMEGKCAVKRPASAGQIAAYENGAGIRFPKQYKEFLRICDGGDLFLPAGVQLYGVAHKPLIEAYCEGFGGTVVMGALSSGDPVLCNLSDGRVFIVNSDTQTVDEEYEDFCGFLGALGTLLF